MLSCDCIESAKFIHGTPSPDNTIVWIKEGERVEMLNRAKEMKLSKGWRRKKREGERRKRSWTNEGDVGQREEKKDKEWRWKEIYILKQKKNGKTWRIETKWQKETE